MPPESITRNRSGERAKEKNAKSTSEELPFNQELWEALDRIPQRAEIRANRTFPEVERAELYALVAGALRAACDKAGGDVGIAEAAKLRLEASYLPIFYPE